MIKTEQIECNKKLLEKTYSSVGLRIRQKETGIVYDEAIDIPGRYTYEETNELVEVPEEEQK